MKILVCGGAGYVGSHTVAALMDKGYEVVVADNLEKGHREAVWEGALLEVGDLRDEAFAEQLFQKHKLDAVIDFAAYSLVGESVHEPLAYYRNNLGATLNILEAMRKNDVRYIVFSSTAAVYGEPKEIPILECAQTLPKNPYGETKLAVEQMLRWSEAAYGIHYAVLRYFNVAGAHISGKIGEDHSPESHLIPNVLRAAIFPEKELKIFGDTYDTPDGTCIRDYVHVTDLAEAHILAVEKIMSTDESCTYNLGNGNGFSNKEILEAAMRVTGIDIPYHIAPQRDGDPARLVASSDKIMKELGWQPKYCELSKILETAWQWHKNHPSGYPSGYSSGDTE